MCCSVVINRTMNRNSLLYKIAFDLQSMTTSVGYFIGFVAHILRYSESLHRSVIR